MNHKSSLIHLPLVEFWLMPAVFVLIVGLLALFDPQSLPPVISPCIERTP